MNKGSKNAWTRLLVSIFFAYLLTYLIVTPLTAVSNAIPQSSAKNVQLPWEMEPSGTNLFTVTGTILDDAHKMPVENVQVFAFTGAFTKDTLTNISGTYTLTLNTGSFYSIIFNPPAGSHLASQGRRGISGTQTLNAILLPGHAISGTVYRDGTKTAAMGDTAIFASNLVTFDGFGLPLAKGDGTYQISLATGKWRLTFTPPHYNGLGPTHTMTITLTADITQDIVLQPGFTISGTVTMSDDDSLVSVPNVEIFAQDPLMSDGFGFGATNAGGRYTGTVPSGTFDILFFAPPFMGVGATVVTNVAGPPDTDRDVILPAGYTVSGLVRACYTVANAFVHAAPEPPVAAGSFGGWGKFAGVDGFYALALQPGIYTFTVDAPGNSPFGRLTLPMINITQDLSLNLDYGCTLFLPLITK